jgi:hypothetical protein
LDGCEDPVRFGFWKSESSRKAHGNGGTDFRVQCLLACHRRDEIPLQTFFIPLVVTFILIHTFAALPALPPARKGLHSPTLVKADSQSWFGHKTYFG